MRNPDNKKGRGHGKSDIAYFFIGYTIAYGALKAAMGIRLDAEQEFIGADLTIHKISATAEKEVS